MTEVENNTLQPRSNHMPVNPGIAISKLSSKEDILIFLMHRDHCGNNVEHRISSTEKENEDE